MKKRPPKIAMTGLQMATSSFETQENKRGTQPAAMDYTIMAVTRTIKHIDSATPPIVLQRSSRSRSSHYVDDETLSSFDETVCFHSPSVSLSRGSINWACSNIFVSIPRIHRIEPRSHRKNSTHWEDSTHREKIMHILYSFLILGTSCRWPLRSFIFLI